MLRLPKLPVAGPATGAANGPCQWRSETAFQIAARRAASAAMREASAGLGSTNLASTESFLVVKCRAVTATVVCADAVVPSERVTVTTTG